MSYVRQYQPNRGTTQSPGWEAWHSGRPRTLAIESLETRYALSTVAGSLDPCPSVAPEEELVELPIATEETIDEAPVDALDTESVGPLEADAYCEAISAPQTPVAAEPEGEFQNEPPVLLSFFAIEIGSYWILSGRVSDDLNPANCAVFFDGVLEGHHTGVTPDGWFMYVVPFSVGQNESISAIAKDSHNGVSNSLSVILSS